MGITLRITCATLLARSRGEQRPRFAHETPEQKAKSDAKLCQFSVDLV
jgi:hypothetical protein